MESVGNNRKIPISSLSNHGYGETPPKVSASFDISRPSAHTAHAEPSPMQAAGSTPPLDATPSLDAMTHSTTQAGRSNSHLGGSEVMHLAERALSILNDGVDGLDDATPFAQLYAMTDAYIDIDSQSRHDILARILRRGVTPDEVIDEVIPATARYMGKLWVHDKLSFADVTIGAARLQETVRAMTVRRCRSQTAKSAPGILLIVPRGEHHTLGIFVLSEQFRRAGCRVHVVVGSHATEIVQLIRRQVFDIIGISAGGRRNIAPVRDLVKAIRSSVPRRCHIIVGGAVTDLGLDLRAVTGADAVCTSAKDAIISAGIDLTEGSYDIKDS